MSNQQEPRLRQQISEYRLMSKLGGGGFGTVYLAEHTHEHTQVAVKVLDIRFTKSEDFKEFINEARTMRLRHPHIIPILDFGISRDDLPFLVMEYAPEGTLRDRHPMGERVPLPTIVSYIDQLASALQYAHEHRVIHRDIKPANILIRADGTLLVSDFGIAKFLEQSLLTSMQKLTGTPEYMAPEQHKGKPCFASDQYALAVIIYQWICGVRPFQGTLFGLAVQHMNTPPPPLRDHLSELSESVESVVLKALAKAPEDRFARIQDFADALHEAVYPPIVPSSTIETIITAPLTPPQQATSQKPEELPHAPTDTEAAPIKPAIQTTDIPVSHQKSPGNLRLSADAKKRQHTLLEGMLRPRRVQALLKRPRHLYQTVAIIALIVALLGGSTYYAIQALTSNISQLSNARSLIEQANGESVQNPVKALQLLSQAQNALLSTQSSLLIGDQAAQYNMLQSSLRQALQKTMVAYNRKELITQLPCTITQSAAISGNVQAMNLSLIQDEKGTLYSYVLASDQNLYQLDDAHRLANPYQFANKARVLYVAGSGQHLFAMTFLSGQAGSPATYNVSVLSFDQPPTLKEDTVAVDSNLIKQGWTPAFLAASGNDVYVVLTAGPSAHQALILYYDANNWHNAAQMLHIPIQPDIVSVAAFSGKQLFLLTSDGHVRILPFGDGGSMPQPNDLLLQNPVSPPLDNDGNNFRLSTPIATPGPQSSKVATSAVSGLTYLSAGSVGGNTHLFLVDNPNHRIMDLQFLPAVSTSTPQTTPTPLGTPTPSNGAGAVSQPSLKVIQQFASTSILSSVKGVTVTSEGKRLRLLTQGGGTLTTISSIDKAPSCSPVA